MGHETWPGRQVGGRQRIMEPFSLEKSSKILEPGWWCWEWEGTHVQLDLDVC